MKVYKRLVILLICFCIFQGEAKSVLEQSKAKNFSLGFQLHEFDNDFGCGINLTFPWFGNNKVAIRTCQDVVFSKLINWRPYGSSRLGMVGSTGLIHGFCRFYGEGGLQVLIINKDLSSDKANFGGYGHFGFEFFFNPETHTQSYFIELGSNGIRAQATKIKDEPMYFNGFCVGVGFRHYF